MTNIFENGESLASIRAKINSTTELAIGKMLEDTDLNTITTGGRYGCIGSGNTNIPKSGEFSLEVFNDGTRTMQIAIYLDSSIYTRAYSGSWSSWVVSSSGDFYKYKIVPTVSSGNLTVTLKNYLGDDPSAGAPVKVQIGGVVRTITSGLSTTLSAGVSGGYFNNGSSELVTKEIDYFTYLGFKSADNSIQMLISRYPGASVFGDFASGNVEKGVNVSSGGMVATDPVTLIGRFTAILSGSYEWSLPGTLLEGANVVNEPVRESRWLSINPTIEFSGTAPTSINGGGRHKYKVVGNTVYFAYMERYNTPALNTWVKMTLPFSTSFGNMGCYGFIAPDGGVNKSVGLLNWVGPQYLFINGDSSMVGMVGGQGFYSI